MIKKILQYLTCEKYMELSSKELSGNLSVFEKISHSFHHIICTFCRRARRQIRVIDELMKKSSNDFCKENSNIKLSNKQKERVKQALKKH